MMASIHQSPWVFTLKAINGVSSSKTNLFSSANLRAYPLRTPKISASLEDSIEDTSPSNSAETGSGDQLGSSDPVKLAFSRAKSYKKSIKSNPGPKQNQNPVAELVGNVNVDGRSVSDDIDGGTKEVPASVKLAMEKAREYKKSKGILGMVGGDKKAREGENVSAGSISDDADGGTKEFPASVKLAMEKSREHKKNKEVLGMAGGNKKAGERENVSTGSISDDAGGGYVNSGNLSNDAGGGTKEVPISVMLAMEKAREYQNKGVTTTADGNKNVGEKDSNLGLEKTNVGNSGGKFVEKRVTKKEELTISSIDFLGLGFSDKRQNKGLPAGLVPVTDPFADGDLPEVELIVGDASKFGTATPLKPELNEDDSDLYKPKVSTWGVFPRPSNISKTYGGGRVVRPGEVLETEEDRAAKEARTRQLLAAYKNKMGLTIDAKLKAECEKALKDGDYFMDLGKLKEALPYYEKVMKELAFQNELHGLAALQWSICQDSLSRPNEARVMYEKLQSHPNVQVSKKARQFMFGFQAMETMKVTSSSLSLKATGYQDYFEAFIEDKTNYTPTENEDEGALTQALPYIIFLVSPIFLILLVALQRGT